MKHFVLGFASMGALMAVVALAFLLFGFADVRADVRKPSWYVSFHSMAVRASVRRRAPAASPLVPADSDLIAGGHLYLNGCAGCHGTPGKTRTTHGWFATPPQFSETTPPYSEPEMYWIINHGVRRTGMSAYGAGYKDIQMWREAAFLKRINDLPAVVSDSLGLPRGAGK